MADEWEEDEWGEAAAPPPAPKSGKVEGSPEAAACKSEASVGHTESSWAKLDTPPVEVPSPKHLDENMVEERAKVITKEVNIDSLNDLKMVGQNDVLKIVDLLQEKLKDSQVKEATGKTIAGLYSSASGELTMQELDKLNTLVSTMAKQKKKKKADAEKEERLAAQKKEEEEKKAKLEAEGEVDDEEFYKDLM